jgi:hypothetical protein
MAGIAYFSSLPTWGSVSANFLTHFEFDKHREKMIWSGKRLSQDVIQGEESSWCWENSRCSLKYLW